ncbi:hypothetical protein GCM10022217_19550 [Chryseobacterium ginsenosidimutans]|uniref:hypothetical protein n=1 Tax=Chryseobacterium ginsenosidimutans TaxID=687846 RepID=UPI0031D61C86
MKTLILPFLFLLTFVVSCKTDDSEILEQQKTSYDVYVGGVDEFNACYWKNGQKVSLAGGENLQGTYLTVDNGDVYMIANNIESLGGNNIIPAWYFWKNGVKYNVAQYLNVAPNTQNEPDNLQIWNNLTVHNGNIYFSGIIKNPAPTSSMDLYQLCSWKNGVKTVLESFGLNNGQSSIGCIGFYNNDTYITTRKNDTYTSGTFNWDIGYYKNNTYSFLTTNVLPKRFISDNSGIYLLSRDLNNKIYIKNVLTGNDLPIPTNIAQTGITEISWDNSDKYYIGNTFYFKNNNQVSISDPNNFNTIGHFTAKDQNIYMTRYNSNVGGTAVKFYINDIEIMSLSNTSRGCFNSIFVDPN